MMSSEFLSGLDRALVIAHVICGTLALIVGPLAMIVFKGGKAHRFWGKVYFGGMTGIFISTILLAYFRFNAFLFIVNVASFYSCFTGYRVLYRKGKLDEVPPATWADWMASSTATLAGLAFIVWGNLGMLGMQRSSFYPFPMPSAFYIIAIVAGVSIAWSGFNDMRRYRMPVVSKRWWWFEHMNRFLSGYIATVTAFMVQNVTRMLPLDYSWVVWVAPGVLGGFLVARWIAHYRAKFGEPQPQGIKWLKRSAPIE